MTGPFSHDALDERRAGYEAAYFKTKDAAMVEKLKSVFDAKVSKDEIRAQTGITDEAVLDRLVTANLRGNLLTVFKLYPLVEVAWADRNVSEAEAKAIESAAEKMGVERGSPAFERLQEWIRKGPTKDGRAVWRLYAEALKTKLSPEELRTFRTDVVTFAKKVADASGELLGIFGNTSSVEARVIKEVEKALS